MVTRSVRTNGWTNERGCRTARKHNAFYDSVEWLRLKNQNHVCWPFASHLETAGKFLQASTPQGLTVREWIRVGQSTRCCSRGRMVRCRTLRWRRRRRATERRSWGDCRRTWWASRWTVGRRWWSDSAWHPQSAPWPAEEWTCSAGTTFRTTSRRRTRTRTASTPSSVTVAAAVVLMVSVFFSNWRSVVLAFFTVSMDYGLK